jgi:hypothetical protein
MLAPRPAARPTLAVLELLLGAAYAACSCRRLLGIFDPADEIVRVRLPERDVSFGELRQAEKVDSPLRRRGAAA